MFPTIACGVGRVQNTLLTCESTFNARHYTNEVITGDYINEMGCRTDVDTIICGICFRKVNFALGKILMVPIMKEII